MKVAPYFNAHISERLSNMLQGIDIYVSNLNDAHAPSWAAIRQAGFSFVFHKTSEWTRDNAFAGRWPELKANGFLRGAYHLPRPNTDSNYTLVDAQLNTFVHECPRLLPGDFGPVLD